jgi:hypothetical protein
MRRLINKDLKKDRIYERATKVEGKEAKKKDERMALYVHNIFSNCEQSVISQSRLCYVANYRLMLERETVQNCGCRALQRALHFHFFGLAKTGLQWRIPAGTDLSIPKSKGDFVGWTSEASVSFSSKIEAITLQH